MFAVLQTPVGVFVLRSPGLCHRDSCVTTKEMLCFPPSKSHIEGNLHNSPWNWGLAQIGELPRGHISEVRTSKAEPGLGLLCQCLQARSWEVFSRVVPLPLCVYSAHPLLRAVGIAAGHRQLTDCIRWEQDWGMALREAWIYYDAWYARWYVTQRIQFVKCPFMFSKKSITFIQDSCLKSRLFASRQTECK